jgi:Phage-related minor tail protein
MAANRDMTASLILRLVDRISGPLAGMTKKLDGIGRTARKMSLGLGLVAGLSFLGPMQQAAAFEDTLRQNAITAGATGRAVEDMVAASSKAYQKLALETGQSSADVAKAAGTLVAANVPTELIDRFLPVLAKAATASGAALEELSATAVSLNQNLKISGPKEMADALGALVAAGKEGRFELRDMAREFPALTAAAEALGLKGRDGVNSLGAMLQVARRGAGTSAEAANNLANFMQKITAPDAVRNFQKMGVDIKAVFQDAAKKGLNPVEVMVEKIKKLTRGDQFAIGQLFADKQVLDFLRPAIANGKEYLRVLEAARKASSAVTDTDFASRSRGQFFALKVVEERVTQIGRRLQLAFGSVVLGPLNAALTFVQDKIEMLDSRFPGLIENVAAVAAGFAVLTTGLGALGLAAGAVAAGLGVLSLPVVATIGVLAALGVAAVSVAKHWDQLVAEWQRISAALRANMDAFAAWMDGWLTRIGTGAMDAIKAAWSGLTGFFDSLWPALRANMDAFAGWMDGWLTRIGTGAVDAIKAAWSGLTGFFDSLWAGITARFDAVIGRVTGAMERLRSLLPSIPMVPGGPGPAPAPRAPGGPGGLFQPMNFRPAGNGVSGRIVVEAAPGARVRSAEASGVDLAPINRGAMLRPA